LELACADLTPSSSNFETTIYRFFGFAQLESHVLSDSDVRQQSSFHPIVCGANANLEVFCHFLLADPPFDGNRLAGWLRQYCIRRACATLASFTFALIISVTVKTRPAIELVKRWISGELFTLSIFIQRHPKTTFNRISCSVSRCIKHA
jgi:hypothetical protein